MTVTTFLEDLEIRGIVLWLEGERLRFRAPKGALTPELRAQLAERRAEVVAGLRARAAARTDTMPLSYSQRSLWLVHQEDPASAAYNVGFAARIVSEVNGAAMDQALQALVDRHASLRTRYPLVDGLPVQSVAGRVAMALERHDAAGLDEAELRRRIEASYRRPFDLAHGPVFRAELHSLSATDHVLLLVVHHIAADGWSLLQMLEELRALYAEATGGPVPPQGRPEVEYADFTRWQAEMLAGPEGKRLADYWKRQLAGPRAQVEVPPDRKRPARRTSHGRTHGFELDAGLSEALRKLARDEGSTLFVVLLAAFKALLFRYTGTDDLIVGTPTFGRNRPEFARVVGDFVNTVALRSQVSEATAFRELLASLRKTVFDALEAQDCPFPLVVELLQPARDPSRSPLFETLFVLQRFDQLKTLEPVLVPNAAGATIDFGGMRLRFYALDQQEGQFDLTLQAVDTAGALAMQLKYNPDLFDAATIARFAGHLVELLRVAVADPARPIGKIALLAPSERTELIERAGAVWRPGEKSWLLHERFEEQARRRPDAVAVTSGGRSLTYGELNRRANQLAHRLRTMGVGRETLVGLCIEPSVDLIVGLVGILKAGGAYLPIDLAYPADRVAFMLADAKAPVLVTQRAIAEKLPGHASRTLFIEEALEGGAEADPPRVNEPDDLVYVIYTSGSTGKPKGTMLTHRAVQRLFSATDAWYGFDESDVWTMFHSVAFDFSVWELWGALLYGGRVAVIPFWVSRDPAAFLELLHAEGVTVLNQTPSAFGQLIQADVASGAPRATKLRYVIFGGEALELQRLRPWFDRHGDARPQLVNMYGITETCVHVTYRPIGMADLAANAGSVIGEPIPDLRVHVLDNAMEPMPYGVVGEMYVGGPGLARGYLDRPELTAARFVSDPFVAGDRLYRTGDLARRRASGELEYLGRIDHQVKIRGFRIELGEIESALGRAPGVKQSVVVAREDKSGDKRLVGYVVSEGRDAAPIRAHLAQSLPDYMVPSAFMFLDALPLTTNGKVDLRALPAPDLGSAESRAYDPPRAGAEEKLAAIWARVLEVPRVGRDDNFFELGGHSLLVVKLQAALQRELGRVVPMVELFQRNTLSEQAQLLDDAKPREAAQPIPRAPRNAKLPVSFTQERLWFFDRLEPGSSTYNMHLGWCLRGSLDVAALSGAFSDVVERHESLRSTFHEDDGGVVQRIAAPRAWTIPVIDAGDAAEARLREEAVRPFDLAKEPPLRSLVVREAPDRHWLLVSYHHIIGDGWSSEVFGREIAQAYSARVARKAHALAALPIQYADYAQWQRTRHAKGELAAPLAWWKRSLEGAPLVLELPQDRPRPPVQSFEGAASLRALDGALRDRLGSLARAERTTLFVALLAAFNTVLSRLAGQPDLVVGVPIAGRERPELEALIGVFIDTVVVRTRIESTTSFRALLGSVREHFQGALAHSEAPFQMVANELAPERDLSRTPVFQVLVNMVNFEVPGEVRFEGLTADPLPLSAVGPLQAKFDLTLYLRDEEGGLTVGAVYNTALYDAARIEHLLGEFEQLLGAAVASPDAPVMQLSLVTPEAASRLPELSAPLVPAWTEPVHARMRRHAARDAAHAAVIDARATVSYGELAQAAARLSSHLRAQGVQRGDIVAILAQRNAGLAWAMLGVLGAGAAFMVVDPAHPASRTEQCVRIAKPRAWVRVEGPAEVAAAIEDAMAAIAPEPAASWPAVGGAAWTQASADPPKVEIGFDDLAYVAFTSGSTGEPKGIAGTHGPISHFFDWHEREHALVPADRFSVLSGLAHDPLLRDVLGGLWTGATLCMPDADLMGEPGWLGSWMRDQRITICHLTPAMADVIGIRPQGEGALELPALRAAFFGGDQLRADTLAALRKAAPQARYANFYGATETPQAMGVYDVPADPAQVPSRIPLGRGIEGVQLLVLAPGGQLAGVGELGEIHVRTPYLARGYLGDASLTAERFVPAPRASSPADRMYRTGDLGRYRPDGTVEFAGRRDRQVKVRGFRIELGEIESTLRTHPALADALVELRAPGGRAGAGEEAKLVAYVVPKAGEDLTATDVRRHLRKRLPEYMVPSLVTTLEAIPLTPNGKVDRKALPDPFRNVQRSAASDEMPAPGIEERLARIWRELLQVERVGAHDNFFELGGHSLLSLRVATAVEKETGWRIDPRILFFQSLRQVAAGFPGDNAAR